MSISTGFRNIHVMPAIEVMADKNSESTSSTDQDLSLRKPHRVSASISWAYVRESAKIAEEVARAANVIE